MKPRLGKFLALLLEQSDASPEGLESPCLDEFQLDHWSGELVYPGPHERNRERAGSRQGGNKEAAASDYFIQKFPRRDEGFFATDLRDTARALKEKLNEQGKWGRIWFYIRVGGVSYEETAKQIAQSVDYVSDRIEKIDRLLFASLPPSMIDSVVNATGVPHPCKTRSASP